MPYKFNAPLWQHVPILRLLAPLLLGILLYDCANNYNINLYFFTTISVCSFVFFICCALFSFLYKNLHLLSFFAAQQILIMLGFGISYVQDNARLPRQLNSKDAVLAIVSAEPIIKPKTIKYEVSIVKNISDTEYRNLKAKALLYVYKENNSRNFQLGDTLLLSGHWQRIRNTGKHSEFDYEQYARRKNILYQQFCSADRVIFYGKYDTLNRSVIAAAHQYCIQSIEQNIKDSTTQALLKAVLVGDERDIDPNTRQAYSDTGIIHIVSISGAHVGILFAAVGFMFRLVKNKKYAWLKFAISLGLVWFYVLLAGGSAPALRAAIMFSIIGLGSIINAQSNPLNQLLSAGFAMLLYHPMWLFTIGFQLSFVAVLSLIIFYNPIANLWQPHNKILLYCSKAIAASIAAEILIAPLVAFYFHSFPPMFIVANVLASVAMSIILCLGMILILVAKISFLSALLASLITLCSQTFHYGINLLQSINITALKLIYLTRIDLVLLYLFIGFAAGFLLLQKQKFIWPALASLLIFSILSFCYSIELRG